MIVQGALNAKDLRFAIVVSRFNEAISARLLGGAKDCIIRHGGSEDAVHVYHCPGSFEVPVVAQRLSKTGKYDAVICLGAVIRGDTPHFDYVAGEAAKGVAQVALSGGCPVMFGILTTDTTEQALERSGGKAGNRGWDAAEGAIEMVRLLEQIQ
jgi:6,7-dimethyl-8-ribityllumazine synthase